VAVEKRRKRKMHRGARIRERATNALPQLLAQLRPYIVPPRFFMVINFLQFTWVTDRIA
jgi:hypothetical protein